jgi:hypothetical protein
MSKSDPVNFFEQHFKMTQLISIQKNLKKGDKAGEWCWLGMDVGCQL